MFDTLTYLSDRIRISFGDSKCPLNGRCPMYDQESPSCTDYRGRTEVGGGRADCYQQMKPGVLDRVIERALQCAGIEEKESESSRE